MIKPNELRLGNKFRMLGGSMVQTVFEIIDNTDRNRIQFESAEHKEMYLVIITCEENRNQYKPWEMEPIPIDESWLLRFGFEKSTEVTWSFGYEKQYSVCRKGNFTYNGVQAAWWFDGKLLHKQPEYVHSLQNLIFALTGEETLNHR